jgi:hypothetical protein
MECTSLRFCAGALAVALAAAARPCGDAANSLGPGPAPVQAAPKVTAEARDEAIRRGFEYLDRKVWELNEGGSPQKQYTIAVTAWASLLAADAEGRAKKLPSRAKELEKLRRYLERYVGVVAHEYEKDDEKTKRRRGNDEKGQEEPDDFAAFSRPAQYVWPVSMAAHYFAESYARGRDKTVARQGLKDAIAILEASQQPNGGWGHDDAARPGMGMPPIRIPKPGGGSEVYPPTLLAASYCGLSALGVAHARLGSKTPESLKKGIEYFRAAQNEDGTYPYDPTQRHALQAQSTQMMGGLEVARTPGAFFALCCAGTAAAGKELRAAAKAMDAHPEWWSEGHGSATMALQFAALAARARGDVAWSAFRRLYFPRILASQEESGGFTCVAEAKLPGVTSDTAPLPGLSGMGEWTEHQKVYVTSVHVLVLLLDRSRPAALPPMPAPAVETSTAEK